MSLHHFLRHTHSLMPAILGMTLVVSTVASADEAQQAAPHPDRININAPDKNGVSHNTHEHFNVGSNGMILNNSARGSETQLGGHIDGNPALSRGEASVIINEVTGRNPSQLNGMLEVAGRHADVIIANPQGITCSGCGFINADRGVLTTGAPMIENGKLKGFDVEDGTISIGGKGFNGRGAKESDIIARAVAINAKIQAESVSVVGGRNKVLLPDHKGDLLQVTSKHFDPSKRKSTPQVSVDVAKLGSMYANRITLVGTEGGVGVNNAGALSANGGGISLKSTGALVNTGFVASHHKGNVDISASGNVTNSGKLSAAHMLSINTGGSLGNKHAGKLDGSTVNLQASGSINNMGSVRSHQKGGIKVHASGDLENKGRMASNDTLSLQASGSLTNEGVITSRHNAQFSSGGDLKNKGFVNTDGLLAKASGDMINENTLKSRREMSLSSSGMIVNAGTMRSAKELAMSSKSGLLNNKKGLIDSGDKIQISTVGTVANQGGYIHASKAQHISTVNDVVNRCDHSAGGKCGIASDTSLDVKARAINTNGAFMGAKGKALYK